MPATPQEYAFGGDWSKSLHGSDLHAPHQRIKHSPIYKILIIIKKEKKQKFG